jgi:hypothetical protein
VAGCLQDSECPTGLICQAQQCVANDGLPPETKDNSVFLEPKTSAHYLFALAPDNNSVAVIDPATLAIQSVSLPEEPFDLELIPGQDAAVIVSRAGQSVSYLSCSSGNCTLQSQKTARRYPAASVSNDGQWAVLWTPDGQVPDQGAEGIVGIVNVAALQAGEPVPIVERAAGRRQTNVFFRSASGAAVDAVMAGQDTVDVLHLAQLSTQLLPQSVPVPDDYAENDTREVVVDPQGNWILFGSLSAMNVGVFAVASAQFQQLPMPGTLSDVELTGDGSTAVVVMRDVGQVAFFPLPAALTDSTQIQTVSVSIPADDCTDTTVPCTAFPGQAVLSPSGRLAALFTNARLTKSFATLDLTTGTVTPFSTLEKLVYSLGIGPDGVTVIVLHQPDTTSNLSDTYEQSVAKSQGFSVVNLQAGVAQLTLTNAVPPQLFVFSSDAAHAAVTLRDDTNSVFEIDPIDLQTLVTSSIVLPSAPVYAGSFANSSSKVWVAQELAAGRISFIDLSNDAVQTATGYALNAGIQP